MTQQTPTTAIPLSVMMADPGNGLCTFLFRSICFMRPQSLVDVRCNQVGMFQDGAPTNHPTLVTRLVQPASDEVRLSPHVSDFHDVNMS